MYPLPHVMLLKTLTMYNMLFVHACMRMCASLLPHATFMHVCLYTLSHHVIFNMKLWYLLGLFLMLPALELAQGS